MVRLIQFRSFSPLNPTGQQFHQKTFVYGLTPNFESALPHMFVEQVEGFPTSLTGSEQLYTAMGSQRVLVGSAVQNAFKLQSLDDNFLLKYVSDASWYQTVKSVGWYSLYPYYDIWDIIWGDDTLVGLSAAPRRFGIESLEGL